ncbi:hypothetical protein [Microvirga massiliensis]|uniref:hypothetical protein n=1 Tax=Microvirga massiliensis TaxID=1033741 RepID=UPI00062B439A|nr:hypothetical protein [Microvirga massiliensis]
MGTLNPSAIPIVLHAITNASSDPITVEAAAQILITGDGPGSHVRALFGDCSADTIVRFAIEMGVETETLKSAFQVACRQHGVVNETLAAALA